MKLTMRSYKTDEDYWRIRTFLREVLRLNQGRQHSWDVCRFDYWRWHGLENCDPQPKDEAMFLWEAEDGELAAVLTNEGRGDAFLHIHPNLRQPVLDAEMLAVAEERLAVSGADGRMQLRVWATDYDTNRQSLLAGCGYTKQAWYECQRVRPMSLEIPLALPAEGFTVQAMGIADEPSRSYASWRAFHPDEPDEKYEGWHWYANVQRCPLYRRDLDIISLATDGEVAGFCTVWFDDANRMGLFEPVGVRPEYHRRGLGRAMMAEGLRRLNRLGAVTAYVGSYSEEAGGLYEAMGFTHYDRNEPWEKSW